MQNFGEKKLDDKKNVRPFGPAVWPDIASIYIYINIYDIYKWI